MLLYFKYLMMNLSVVNREQILLITEMVIINNQNV